MAGIPGVRCQRFQIPLSILEMLFMQCLYVSENCRLRLTSICDMLSEECKEITLIHVVFTESTRVGTLIVATIYLQNSEKLRGLSPRANCTDRAAAAGRRS